MTSSRQALDQVINKLKEPMYIIEYLTSSGYDTNKKFHCPNPDHPDKHPSAGLIRQGNRGYCFSCQTSFDIFDLVVWLEGRPSSGPGWVTETVKYLADRFNIPFEAPDLTPEELRECEVITAYSHAYQIIRHFKDAELPEIVQQKVVDLGYDQGLRYKLGIGSVNSYEDFLHRMTVQYKHSLELLQSCDLADTTRGDNKNFNPSRLFCPTSLIYTIRDVDGRPVGFSARNLAYEQQMEEWDKESGKGQPKKYVHTREDGTLFHKSNLLFNLDLAKKFDGPVTVVEGNSDCVSLYAGGELGVVGTLGTAFTRDHLDLLLSLGKRHIIVGLDNDKAGKKGVERIVNLVQEVSGTVGLRLEVVVPPVGVKDPDQYVRSFGSLEKGADAWRKLERIDLFSWSVKQRIEAGEDPFTICETTIPLIVNEVSNIVRNRMAKQLAQFTNVNEDFVVKEVLRLVDKENARLDEERAIISDNLLKKIRQDPSKLEAHISTAVTQLEVLSKRKAGYNLESILKTVDLLFDQKEKNVTRFELRTGYPIFDSVFDGIPRFGSLMSFPGKPHHGKSILIDNLINGLIDHNDEVMILLHTIDDSTNDRINRLLGARTGMDSSCFRRPGYYMNDPQGQMESPCNFHERYYAAKAWFRRMHEEERLLVLDPGALPGTLECLKSVVQELRKKYPDRSLIVVGDNFHLYSMTSNETGEAYIRSMSRFVNEEIISLGVTAMFTMEIPSESMKPGTKPTYLNLKGSRGLSFDAKANCSVYNELQDWKSAPENVSLWWESPDYQMSVTNPDGVVCRVPVKKPVIEVIVDKNKISGKSTSVFFKLENLSGKMYEASAQDQQSYVDKLAAAAAARETRDRDRSTRAGINNSRAPYKAKL